MKQVAEYKLINGKKCFTSIQEAVSFEGEYHKFANSTYTLPKVQANENQYLVLENEGTENEAWILCEKTLEGTFYEKQGGKMENEIFLRDLERYTEVPKLEEYEDGTVQTFNEELQVWEYIEKGKTLLEKELKEELEKAKKERLAQLENDFNASKLIVIQNGHTLIIRHDTKEREEFIRNIEIITNEYNDKKGALIYWQEDIENRCTYNIALSTYIWNYLFSDLFSFVRPSGYKTSSRIENKLTYQTTKAKILNATTLEEIMKISYNFINPNGLVIDISIKAKEIFDNPNTPASIKEEIVKMTTEDGIHLIKKILC